MNPEERSLLERTYKIAQENNEILKSLRSSARWGTAMKVVYWVIIVGISIGSFYFIQPYIEFMTGALGITGKSGDTSTTTNSHIRSTYENNIENIKTLLNSQ